MHYNIDYTEIKDPAVKQAKAIQDIKDWMGEAKFKQVHDSLLLDIAEGHPPTREFFIKSLAMFAGIEGYPAEAWCDLAGLPSDEPEPPIGISLGS